MERFIVVEKGMCGYYVALADNYGPLGRIEDWSYETYEEALTIAEEIAIYENIRCLG
jgi:hypothetical protein